MKRIFIFLALAVGLIWSPAIGAESSTSATVKAPAATSSYAGKKDKAYWTRVWYQKQAAKGRRYKDYDYEKNKVRIDRKKASKKKTSKRSSIKKRAKRVRSKKRSKRYASKKRNRKTARRTKRRGNRILAKVDLSSQRMKVYKGGKLLHSWKVSTGRKGYGTPTGTWSVKRMHKEYYSRKYDNAPMPYAMFYSGGFAIHGTGSISRLGRTASHGCVRLHPSNAAKLFAMVRRNGGTVKVTY